MAYQRINDQLEHLVKVYGSFGTSHGLKRSTRSRSSVRLLGTRHHMLSAPAELYMDQCCT